MIGLKPIPESVSKVDPIEDLIDPQVVIDKTNQDEKDKNLDGNDKNKDGYLSPPINIISNDNNNDDDNIIGKTKGEGDGQGDTDGKTDKGDSGNETIEEQFFNKFGKIEGIKINSTEELFSAVEAKLEDAKVEGIQELYSEYPIVQEIIEHLSNGGTEEDFVANRSNKIDFTKIQINNDDIDQQEAIYVHDLRMSGVDESEIPDMVQLAKDKNTLLNKATNSLNRLTNYQKQQTAATEAKRAKDLKAENDRVEQEWNQVSSTLKSGKILNVQLAKEEIDKLNQYISKPVDRSGNTQRDIDRANLSIEQQLFIDYLISNKFNIAGLKAPVKSGKQTLEDLKKQNDNRIKVDLTNSNTPNEDKVYPITEFRKLIKKKQLNAY